MSTPDVHKGNTKNTAKQSTMSDTVSEPDEVLTESEVFIHQHKRKLVTSSVVQPKRYVLDSNQLCKDNKYHVLSEHCYAFSSSNKNVSEDMDHDDSAIDDQKNNRKPKIPPIFLHNVNNHQEIIKDIKTVAKVNFSTQVRGQSLKINLGDIDDFRSLTAFYDKSGVKYHTFQTPQDRKLEVIIRNVPSSLSENEIKTELLDQNYPVIRVTRLLNKTKLPLPLCAVDLENSEDSKAIFKLNTLFYAVVSVEPKRKSKQIPQCTRCQRYGHTKNFCKLDPRCVRCTGQHHYSDCPKKRTEPPQCVNCGENHSANFRGCQTYQEIVKNKSQSKQRPVQNPLRKINNETQNPNIPDLHSQESFPKINDNSNLPHSSHKSRVSYSKAVTNTPQETSANPPDQTDGQNNDISISPSLEQIILEVVKSFMPLLKKVITNVITSVLSNGSV